MALINCQECGREIIDQNTKCIHCGFEVVVPNKTNVYNVIEERAERIKTDAKFRNRETAKGCLVILVILVAIFKIGSCLFSTKTETIVTENTIQVPQFKLMEAENGGEAYLEKFYGKPTETEKSFKEYPCKDKKCGRLTYANENEAILENGQLYWLTVKDSTIRFNDDAIKALGLEYRTPDVKTDFRYQWYNYNGWAIDINGAKNSTISFMLCKKLSTKDMGDLECDTRFRSNCSEIYGTYKPLAEAVKRNMNDPSSFDHVGTTVAKSKDGGHIVLMEYRGKNAFGATILTSTKVKVSCDGSMQIID